MSQVLDPKTGEPIQPNVEELKRRAIEDGFLDHVHKRPRGMNMHRLRSLDEPVSCDPYVRQGRKTGRNEPCPCGSGRKYKRCHHPRAVI